MGDLRERGNQIIGPKVDVGCRSLIGARSNTLVSFPTHPAYVHIPIHIDGVTTKWTGLETRHSPVLLQVEYSLEDEAIEA